ncbi:TPA: hypothetical protein N0F65_005348 [Lagenidium giganteum]|uniref:Uncharacterized protein n=1 Tax=Lagenidium giganteum TaxID=4803 RepID=A0AAV2YX68_9STRA|nr:TPA: hypothetical protein N0F65_005348 [Lagenidium giganteum]
MAAAPRKKVTFLRVKDLTPALADKECSIKAIVMESNAKDEANTSTNATLLVGDETGCVSVVLTKALAVHVRLGDIIQFVQSQLVLKNSRIYLWGGKVERVGDFTMLFKEAFNVSNVTWVKDPKNPDNLVRAARVDGALCVCLIIACVDFLTAAVCADPWSESSQAAQARQGVTRACSCACRPEREGRRQSGAGVVAAAAGAQPSEGSFKNKRKGSVSSSSSADRRSSTHHRSFVFPAHEILPASTVIQPQVVANAATRRTLQTSLNTRVFPHGSDSGDASNRSSGKRADMQLFPLRFRDPNLEEIFCKHFNLYVLNKVRMANQIAIVINAGMLVAQYFTHPRAVEFSTFASRVMLIGLSIFYFGLSFLHLFQVYFDQLVFAHYFVHGLVLLLPRLFFLVRYWSDEEVEADAQTTLFCTQKSVRMMSLL